CRSGRGAGRPDRGQARHACLPARRPECGLWRADAGAGCPAQRGLPEGGAGRAGGRAMSERPARSRMGGWVLSATTAASLLSGAAAWALAADRQAEPLFLDLGRSPPAAPAVAAVAEAAPEVMDESPPAPDDPAPPEARPDMPEPDTA